MAQRLSTHRDVQVRRSRFRWLMMPCAAPLALLAACSSADPDRRALDRSAPLVGKRPPARSAVPLSMPRRPGFEENRGQFAAPVTYAARDGAAMLFLTPDEAVWRFRAAGGSVRMRWLGANPFPVVLGADPVATRVNYARGQDRSKWQAGVPLYRRVTYRDLYPGIDLVFHDERGALEYDWVVAPGADPGAIRVHFDGPQIGTGPSGDLELTTSGGDVIHRRPVAFQDVDGEQRSVAASYETTERSAHGIQIAFAVGEYDRSHPLIIDPTVGYQTDVDPAPYTDDVVDSAVDAQGNLWLAGMTGNADFPLTNPVKETKSQFDDGYVVKINPDGDIVFASYFGGSFFNCLGAIDVDADGNAYVAGTTISDDFPVTTGAAQPTYADGQGDGFLSKFGPDGQLLYSTYFGGTGYEQCSGRGLRYGGVAVAPDGSVYLIVSVSTSTQIPAPGATRTRIDGDFFIVRFDADMRVQWGRFLGSPGAIEQTTRVRTDAAGNAYVLGQTGHVLGAEHEFPLTDGAFQTTSESDQVNFVVKFATNGDLAYATLLGARTGNDSSGFRGDLDVDAEGNAYIVYFTGSPNGPVTPGAYQPMLKGFSDLFVAKLDRFGTGLVYGTYLGGSGAEQPNLEAFPIAVDEDGHAYVGGYTFSTDYPQRDAFESRNTGNVLTKLNADGTDIIYSSFVPQGVHTIAVGGGAAYVAGRDLDSFGTGAVRIDDGGPAPCPGDCNGDGVVLINELVLGVAIALSQQPLSACSVFDTDGDGLVTIAELIAGVGSLLRGC